SMEILLVADDVAYVGYDTDDPVDEYGELRGNHIMAAFSPPDSSLALSEVVRRTIESKDLLWWSLPATIWIPDGLVAWFREAKWQALLSSWRGITDPPFPGARDDIPPAEQRAAYEAAFEKAIS
ncbi:hypothetical protein ACFL5T_04890, partial [Gemmatimonadota bacterium]